MFERTAALASFKLPVRGRDVTMGEKRGWTLLQVAAFPSTHAELRASLQGTLGAQLPATVGVVVSAGARKLLKTGAEQYWILSSDGDEIDCAVPPDLGAVTPLTHSRTCIFVEGAGARSLLAQGVPLDLHPDSFRIDDFALTGLHHTPVLLHRCALDRYELYALRTYAVSVWEWVADAGYAITAS